MLMIFRYVASTANVHTGAMNHVHPVVATVGGSASIKANAPCHAQRLATNSLVTSDARRPYLVAINAPVFAGKTAPLTAASSAACGTTKTRI
jgi:hypothetical protein